MANSVLSNALNKYKVHIEIAFGIIQAVLHYFTLFTDKSATASFSMIVLCFIFSVVFITYNKHNYMVAFAMFFTLVSDLFLVVLLPETSNEMYRTLAMVTFSGVQLYYFCYLIKTTFYKNYINHVIIRITVGVISTIVTVIVLNESVNFLAVISVFYYANLIANCVYAFINFKGSPLFAIGLLLFVFCDTFVGVQVGSEMFFTIKEGTLLYKIFFANFNFTWLFYGFSQVAISLSVLHNRLGNSKLKKAE